VSDDELEREVRKVHQGNCPVCNGPGPVDVHTTGPSPQTPSTTLPPPTRRGYDDCARRGRLNSYVVSMTGSVRRTGSGGVVMQPQGPPGVMWVMPISSWRLRNPCPMPDASPFEERPRRCEGLARRGRT
jgi:hypothetical protein